MAKWTLLKVTKEFEKLSAKFGDTLSVPVQVNNRLTRTLGRFMFNYRYQQGIKTVIPDRIEMSKQLLETATDDCIMGVIKHEWAHYYIAKTTKVDHGHDSVFKRLCDKIGTWGTTTTHVERIVEVNYKYETFCTCCGKRTGAYSRAGKSVQHPELFRSTCCKKAIKVVQNF